MTATNASKEYLPSTPQLHDIYYVCGARTADPSVGGVGMDQGRTFRRGEALSRQRGTMNGSRKLLLGGTARPDSDTTVQYAPGTVPGHCRSLAGTTN